MRLLVADDIGLVKEINALDKSVSYVSNTSGADLQVLDMVWLNSENSKVAVCRSNGIIDIYELSSSSNEWGGIKFLELEEPFVTVMLSGNTYVYHFIVVCNILLG